MSIKVAGLLVSVHYFLVFVTFFQILFLSKNLKHWYRLNSYGRFYKNSV